LPPAYSPLMSKAKNTKPIFPRGPLDPVSDEADAWDVSSTPLPQFEPEAFEPEAGEAPVEEMPVEELSAENPPVPETPALDTETPSAASGGGLDHELASARELANAAIVSEDRTRHALYEAIG